MQQTNVGFICLVTTLAAITGCQNDNLAGSESNQSAPVAGSSRSLGGNSSQKRLSPENKGTVRCWLGEAKGGLTTPPISNTAEYCTFLSPGKIYMTQGTPKDGWVEVIGPASLFAADAVHCSSSALGSTAASGRSKKKPWPNAASCWVSEDSEAGFEEPHKGMELVANKPTTLEYLDNSSCPIPAGTKIKFAAFLEGDDQGRPHVQRGKVFILFSKDKDLVIDPSLGFGSPPDDPKEVSCPLKDARIVERDFDTSDWEKVIAAQKRILGR